MKVHLHEEQFDGALHAACYTLDADAGDPRIVDEIDFVCVPVKDRCKACSRIEFPRGDPGDEYLEHYREVREDRQDKEDPKKVLLEVLTGPPGTDPQTGPLSWLKEGIKEIVQRGPAKDCDDVAAYWEMINELRRLHSNGLAAVARFAEQPPNRPKRSPPGRGLGARSNKPRPSRPGWKR